MQSDAYKYYKAQKGFRQILPFPAVFSIFLLFGLLPFFFNMPTAGFIISGFCFSVLSGLLFKASGFGKKYAIGEKSVLLKCGRKTVNLSFDEIKSVSLLTKQEARSFLEEMHLASVTAERQLDFRGWIKSQCRSGEVVRFMSIPLTGTDQRAGHPANIIKYTVKPNEELILLRTLKSRYFLISPKNIRGFFNELETMGAAVEKAAAGEGKKVHPPASPEEEIRVKQRSRGLFIYSAVIGFSLLLFFVIIPVIQETLFTSYPEEISAPGPENQKIEKEKLMAVWENDSTFIFSVPSELLSGIELDGGVSGDIYERHAAPLVLKQFEYEGLLSEGLSEKQDLIDYTASILVQAKISNEGKQISKDGKTLFLFRMQKNGIREIIMSFLGITEKKE